MTGLTEAEREAVEAWAEEWIQASERAAGFGAKLSAPEAEIAVLVARLLDQTREEEA